MTEDRGRAVPPHGSGGQVLSPSEPATHVTVEVAAAEIAHWAERATKAEARGTDLLAALKAIQTCAFSDGRRTFDACISALGWIDDHARAALAKANGEQPSLSTSEGEG